MQSKKEFCTRITLDQDQSSLSCMYCFSNNCTVKDEGGLSLSMQGALILRSFVGFYSHRQNQMTPIDVELAVKVALTSINEEFLHYAKENSWPDGSTAVFAILLKEFLVLGNIGNSRGVICNKVESCQDLLHKPSGGTPVLRTLQYNIICSGTAM